MYKSYKYRIYPNKAQIINIEKHISYVRFIYNYFLSLHLKEYKETGESWSKYRYLYMLPQLKKAEGYSWLKDVNSQSLQQAIMNLDMAFKNMFNKRVKIPRFKKKNKAKATFSVPQHGRVSFKERRLYIPKFTEGIKCIFHRRFEGKIKNITVSRKGSDKYYVSINVWVEEIQKTVLPVPTPDNCLEIRYESDRIVLSDGTTFTFPEFAGHYRKLKQLHKKLSRKKKKSKNREITRRKLSNLYEKIENIKKDCLHKITREIVNKSHIDYYILEELKSEKHRSITFSFKYTFSIYLNYKAEWSGKIVKVVPQGLRKLKPDERAEFCYS